MPREGWPFLSDGPLGRTVGITQRVQPAGGHVSSPAEPSLMCSLSRGVAGGRRGLPGHQNTSGGERPQSH